MEKNNGISISSMTPHYSFVAKEIELSLKNPVPDKFFNAQTCSHA